MSQRYGAITENIAVLALCDSTFEPVTEYPLTERGTISDDNHKLSLKHELQLAEAFAVLLANDDDPSAVGAVCIEEQETTTGLVIRTAVNVGDQKERMAQCDQIAQALKSCSIERDQETFFEEILKACQPRVLSRLRSVHAKPSLKARKPPIIRRLMDGARELKNIPQARNQLALVEGQIAALGMTFDELESLTFSEAHAQPGKEMLKGILFDIEQLLKQTNLESIFGLIPKTISSWSGYATEILVIGLEKLAQYRSAAEYLLRQARRDPNVRNVIIQAIPNRSLAESIKCSEPVSVSAGLLSRCLRDGGTGQALEFRKKLETRIGMNKAKIMKEVGQHACRTKRVHAEIQLLLYYETTDSTRLRPRIICSNKHACLLCSLFIKAHGRFYIPSCHGRLYPRWRIPELDTTLMSEDSNDRLLKSLDDFNDLLEDKIKTYLNQFRRRLPDPNESIIFVPAVYTPSAISIITSKETTRDEHESSISSLSKALKPEARTQHTTIATAIKHQSIDGKELYRLRPGCSVHVRLLQGLPIRLHTHHIHMELTHEWASSVGLFQPGGTVLLIRAEWIDSPILESLEYMIDLDCTWASKKVPDGALFSDIGLALKYKNDIVVLRVLN